MKNQSKAKKEKNPTSQPQNPKDLDLFSLCTNMSNLFHSKTEYWKCGSSGSCSCSTTVSGKSEADVYWLNGENSTYFVYFIVCFYRNGRVFVYTNVPWVLLFMLLYQLESLSCCSGNTICRLKPVRSFCSLWGTVSLWGGINSTVESWSKIQLTVTGNITWVSLYGAFLIYRDEKGR